MKDSYEKFVEKKIKRVGWAKNASLNELIEPIPNTAMTKITFPAPSADWGKPIAYYVGWYSIRRAKVKKGKSSRRTVRVSTGFLGDL